MARLIDFKSNKDYASKANAIKAVEKKFGPSDSNSKSKDGLDYFIYQNDEGRFLPVFLGERALQAQVHFYFNVAG